MNYQRVSIIIPVYNEAKTIAEVIGQVILAQTFMIPKEIVVVDDASTDETVKIIQALNNPDIKLIRLPVNQGKGAALRVGFEHATGDIIVVQDADLEYDPKELKAVLKPFIENEADVVYGSRYLVYSAGRLFWHTVFNKLFTGLGNLLLGSSLTDLMTCYKAFSRTALNRVAFKLESKRFGFEPEVTARVIQAGFKIVEVPVSYSPRTHKDGKHMNIKGEIDSLLALIKYSLH